MLSHKTKGTNLKYQNLPPNLLTPRITEMQNLE